ncbi:MAG TPA: hypothetical protein VNH21_13615 [Steroidobacteraceae bacterium]|nr:hypothetical protein [Steroidobacteraceae bacterium]
MTKAELLAALLEAPDHATVYIDPGDGVLRSVIIIEVFEDLIAIGFEEIEP